ncbi:hypothetical protein HN935_03200 [archaeon]|jgi:hypothetical protein|nr:hypothetical protein [archaeon]
MVIHKRAQFFLLAAVIISAVVISLGITANRATVNREPGNFYDYSYEVNREVGAVIDYEIYSGFDEGANLSLFVDLLARDIRDKSPDANFLFVYGDTVDGMNVTNYGTETANVGSGGDNDAPDTGVIGGGSRVISRICTRNHCSEVSDLIDTFNEDVGTGEISGDHLKDAGDDVVVEVAGYEYEFPVSRHRRVIFIMQKDVNDESFVTAK